MRKITIDELKEIIDKHKKWMRNEEGGERANLSGSDLSGSDLSFSNLSGSNLSGSNLSFSDLSGSDLSGSNLSYELLNKFLPIVCPEHGAFVGWKKCRNDTIVKLEICESAKRSSAYGRKCRCSSAKVLAIEHIDGTQYELNSVASGRDASFVYRVVETVCVDNFDDDRRNECSTGIHFFITRQEAVDYEL